MAIVYPDSIRERGIALYKGGLSSRKVARRLGVDQKTILNWAHSVGFRRDQGEAQSGERHRNYGKRLPKETREKISRAQRGKKLSRKHREKLSAAKIGKPPNKNCILGSVRYHRGWPLSHDHRRKIAIANSGANSSSWKGGVTPENDRIRKSVEFKIWREKVFERDNWTCQDCGKRGGYLEPHHKKSFAEFPELRFDVDNGITYCHECHKKNDEFRY